MKGYFLENDGAHYYFTARAYGLTDDKSGVVRLFRSKKGVWTEKYKGTLAAELVNDGNGFTVEFDGKDGVIRLDYCQAIELELLLRTERVNSRKNGFKGLLPKKVVVSE